jgi:hypothetical protein
MNSQRLVTRIAPRMPLVRRVVVGFLCMTGGISVLAFADGPTQPDPPVPLERASHFVARTADREPDCRCGVLHARDIESRVEGHVERWEALTRGGAAVPSGKMRGDALRSTSFVEGVIGFPVGQFRLASDTPGDDISDDGAGSD